MIARLAITFLVNGSLYFQIKPVDPEQCVLFRDKIDLFVSDVQHRTAKN